MRSTWHLAASTLVLRGRHGTHRHPPSFRVAELGLGYCHSAWQNWDLVTATCVLRGRRHLAQPLCHIHLSHTIFVRHCLSHTTLSHTIFHTQLCHTRLCHPQLCHIHLSHTIFVRHCLSHTTLSHTIFHTPSFTVQQISLACSSMVS